MSVKVNIEDLSTKFCNGWTKSVKQWGVKILGSSSISQNFLFFLMSLVYHFDQSVISLTLQTFYYPSLQWKCMSSAHAFSSKISECCCRFWLVWLLWVPLCCYFSLDAVADPAAGGPAVAQSKWRKSAPALIPRLRLLLSWRERPPFLPGGNHARPQGSPRCSHDLLQLCIGFYGWLFS